MFPSAGIAAGACEGNGILIDIRDPANPVRIDAAQDNNYAYWHGATFSNDGGSLRFSGLEPEMNVDYSGEAIDLAGTIDWTCGEPFLGG